MIRLFQYSLFIAVFALGFAVVGLDAKQEDKKKIMADFTAKLRNDKIDQKALKVGETFPEFSLQSTSGRSLGMQELMGEKGLVITFYRGSWCPYCNTELKKLKMSYPDFQARGFNLVAIAPEKLSGLITTSRKHELNFPLLSDTGNELARKISIAFALEDDIRRVYEGFGIDLKKSNLDERYELPVPATYVLDSEGKVLYRFLDVDYKQRVSHKDLLEHMPVLAEVNQAGPVVYRAKINGMTCGYCSGTIKKKLKANSNVLKAEVSHESGSGVIEVKEGSLSKEEVKSIIQSAGFGVESIE